MNDEVDLALQDLVDRPTIRLLSVDLPLVSVGLWAELRVPRVPQVRIRDVSNPYYLSPPFKTCAILDVLYGGLTRLQSGNKKQLWGISGLRSMFGDQLSDRGHQRVGDFHKGLVGILESGLVFGDRFFFGLLLVVREDLPHPLFVPARWEPSLAHHSPLRRRLR